MTQSIFSDVEDDLHPDSFDKASRGKSSMSDLEILREDILALEKKVVTEEGKKNVAETEKEKSRLRLDAARQRKEEFLKSYQQVFREGTPSLGNFEEEIAFLERESVALDEKIRAAETVLKTAQEELEAKKKALIEMERREEEERKREKAAKPVENDSAQSPEEENKKISKQKASADGMKEYWETLSWEEKKKIFSVRDTLAEKMDEGAFDWKELLNRLQSDGFSNVFSEEDLEKMRAMDDGKKGALFLTILAYRLGKISDLEGLIERVFKP